MTEVLRDRILVAEDHPHLRRILCLYLQSAGYETREARNGQEALDESRSADVVLLDVMMPLQDGFSLCEQIQKSPEGLPRRVILCTARNQMEDGITALKIGADEYIVKPFTRDAVLEKVLSVQRRRPLQMEWSASWGWASPEHSQPVFRFPIRTLSSAGFCAAGPGKLRSLGPALAVDTTLTFLLCHQGSVMPFAGNIGALREEETEVRFFKLTSAENDFVSRFQASSS